MLKLIRNTLGDMNNLYDWNGNNISWDHIKKQHFQEKEKGVKATTKFTSKIKLLQEWKKNVKLAAQVFSNSVRNTSKFCQSLEKQKFKDIDATAEFCLMITNAFYILNCRTRF